MKQIVARLLAGLAALTVISSTVSAQSLQTALDAANLMWTTSSTGGGNSWFGQTATYYFGGSAAQSGVISSTPQTSTLQTTVTGPGTFTFWWKVSTTFMGGPSAGSSLVCKANGTTLAGITNNVDWTQQTVYLGSGSQMLQWNFAYYTFVNGAGTGWVDQVTWIPGTALPTITSQPSGQAIVQGLDATFRLSAGGTPPLAYQWQFNGTNLDGATNAIRVITNVQPGNLGSYCVVVTNSVGSVTSSIVPLVFGNVAAWGGNSSGETYVPYQCTNAIAVSGGASSSLILNADHTVTGWGYYETNVPADLTNVIGINAFNSHSLALRSDGTMAGWGSDSAGDTVIPADLTNVVALVGGGLHSLALRSDGTVVAWGDNTYGQTNVPPGLSNVVQIAGGINHSVALQANGVVVAWGANYSGQTNVPSSLTNAVAVAAGLPDSLALRSDGTVVSWGPSVPVPSYVTNAVAIAGSSFLGLALKSDGTVIAWGVTGTSAVTNVPSALTNVIAIAVSSGHALALVGNGPPLQQIATTNIVVDSAGCHLAVPSQCGRVFRLEYKNDLNDPDWTPFPLVAGTGNNLTLSDPTAATGARFYRVRRW